MIKKVKSAPLWAKILGGFAIFAGLNFAINRDNFGVKEEAQATQEVAREKTPEEKAGRFFGFDGESPKLSRYIKKQLNDPESFQHIKTAHKIEGGQLKAFTEFRAKNGFGALVKTYGEAVLDLETGEVISCKIESL